MGVKQYIVALGEHRGSSYIYNKYKIYLPNDMLPDGTIVTQRSQTPLGNIKVHECRHGYSYPPILLKEIIQSKSMVIQWSL